MESPSEPEVKIIYHTNIEFDRDTRDIKERFRNLAIFRTLQLDRHININSLKAAVLGTDSLIRSFAGVIGAVNNAGLIVGEPAGLDKHGRPYKDWKIADAEQARALLKRRKIRPLPPEAIEIIKQRAGIQTKF